MYFHTYCIRGDELPNKEINTRHQLVSDIKAISFTLKNRIIYVHNYAKFANTFVITFVIFAN